MPNLRDIKDRIRSVRNTQKVTRAMKMVAAAKLRRAQDAALQSRPYATKLGELLRSIVSRADLSAHPLFAARGPGKVLLVVVTADRGLCGGFNTNLSKAVAEAVARLRAAQREVVLFPVGRKGRDYFRRRHYPIAHERVNVFAKLAYGHARLLADELTAMFLAGEAGEIVLAYNEFKSIIAPRIVIETLLPIPRPAEAGAAPAAGGAGHGAPRGDGGTSARGAVAADYIYEPDPQALLENLVPWHLRTQVWRVLQESWAAEQAARMAAMEGATKNAGEMIDRLTLTMNKVRQAAITKELIEVVSGAAALS